MYHGQGAMGKARAAVSRLVLAPRRRQEVLAVHIRPVEAAGQVLGGQQWGGLVIVVVVLRGDSWPCPIVPVAPRLRSAAEEEERCDPPQETVRRFVRMMMGEGLKKKEENFAEEVAKAAKG